LKRLSLIIPIVTLVLVMSAVGCGSNERSAPNVDATVAAAVAATRTASDVQQKVAATMSAPTLTTAPPTPTTESAPIVKKVLDKVIPLSESHYNDGIRYYELGQYQSAIQEFGKAIQLNPDDADYYNNRSASYTEIGQFQLGINDYTKAIQLSPDDGSLEPDIAVTYANRAYAYDELGEYQNAIDDLSKAIELDPDNIFAYFNRSVVYNMLGEFALSDADKKMACSLDSQYC
jgi:tetratricopeptide (TPR) repeat protein